MEPCCGGLFGIIMLLKKLSNYKIILASASPRRNELLNGLGINFKVELNGEVDESFDKSIPLNEISSYISVKKSKSFHRILQKEEILITADTVVICENRVLGKPSDLDDAKVMLSFLSGKTHTVSTGVTIRSIDKIKTFAVTTQVSFRELTNEEIDYYVINYSPMDKAGSYGAQDWIGFISIERIEGSYFNVMGFPVHTFYSELENFIS